MAANPVLPVFESLHPEAFPGAVTPELAKSDPDEHYRNRLLQVYQQLRQKTLAEPGARDGLLAPLPTWARSYRLDAAHLAATPRLQPALVGVTAYSPGKWLLEQELAARKADVTGGPTWDPTSGKDVFETAAEARLCGIGLSGGGIRSATFSLGILQAFAAAGKLLDAKGNSAFDYLASVSGGGYIHQWLLSWSWNEEGGFPTVARRLVPPPAPGSAAVIPDQITWLRRYSSYLTPQRGLLSADSWTMATTWLRNTTLNQIILFSFFALCIICGARRGLAVRACGDASGRGYKAGSGLGGGRRASGVSPDIGVGSWGGAELDRAAVAIARPTAGGGTHAVLGGGSDCDSGAAV